MAELPEEVTRLLEAIEALAQIEDDLACAQAVSKVLEDWPKLHARLREIREERVKGLKDTGMTWKEIGALLGTKGVSAARAQQIATGLRGKERPAPVNPRKKRPPADPPTG